MSFHHSALPSASSHAGPQIDSGWIRFVLPGDWQHRGIWRVRVGETSGKPGERIIAPAGNVRVIVEAAFAMPGFQAEGTLAFDAEVQPAGLTEITLPLTHLLELASARLQPALADE